MRTLLALLVIASPALAEAPVVTAATVRTDGAGAQFDVTLTHPDTGWDHYADAWRVETPSGDVLGIRELAHPHVEEQPFTRSLSGVVLPDSVKAVVIRARCKVDGWSDEGFTLQLP
jgi:hypothetical protein